MSNTLPTRDHDESIARVAAIVAAALDVPCTAVRVTLRPALAHQSNRLYDAAMHQRHLIVKEYLQPGEQTDAPRREWAALARLAPADIAPKPVRLHPTFDAALGPLVIYDYMPGQMWGRHRPPGRALTDLARLWLVMHAVPVDGLGLARGYESSLAAKAQRFRAQFEAYASWAAVAFPPGVAAAEQCLEVLVNCMPIVGELDGADPHWCFCRGDARFANVIERPDGRLGMVDWEDSGLGDAARNVADLLLAPDQEDLLTTAQWDHFLRPYLAARTSSDPDLKRRIDLYCTLSAIFWLAVILRHGLQRAHLGQATHWLVNGLPVNARLQRYLARARAWRAPNGSVEVARVRELRFFPDT